jgi:protein-disulfide isomerase
MSFGVLGTPAIVINDKIKSYGRIPTTDEIKKWIQEENKK